MRQRTGLAAFTVAALLVFAAPAAAYNYVALGDSYSSGVGTNNYDLDATCKRSSDSYPAWVQYWYGWNMNFKACTGATTTDVINNQVGALSATTDLVTMTVGGNDAGFASVVTACNVEYNCYDDIDTARSFIANQLPSKLDAVYREIYNRARYAKVRILNYPKIFKEQKCTFYSGISAAEQVEMNKLAVQLSNVIKGRAAYWGFGFVDVIPSFVSHEICTADPWINGVASPVSDSYHPNKLGYKYGYWYPLYYAL